jgi:transposase
MKRIIDLRKQRVISPAADRMSLVDRRRRPLSQSLMRELSRTFEKIGVDTKKLEGIAKRDQRERLRFHKKEMAMLKRFLPLSNIHYAMA